MNFTISFMEKNDIPETAKVLSCSLIENPMLNAVFKGNGKKERLLLEKRYVSLLENRPEFVFTAKKNDQIIGVMRMSSCNGNIFTVETQTSHEEDNINSRQNFWLNEWEKRDPKEQHWHLGPVGVLKSHRNLGVGSKLMERFCIEVDNSNSFAYLETDLDSNVEFYRKFDFEIVDKSHILGVENKFMVRKNKKNEATPKKEPPHKKIINKLIS